MIFDRLLARLFRPRALPTQFVVSQNALRQWTVVELDSFGCTANESDPYVRKANAVKAAKRLAALTPGATWKVNV